MKRPGGLKGKLPLLFSTFVALLAVFTASVSTFAWFQAQASVNIQTTTTSTSITVNKPDDYAFYAYKGNTDSSHTLQDSFSSDFTLITSDNIATETSLVSLKPGDVKTFCLVIEGHDPNKNISLNITKITSNDASMQSIGHRYVYNEEDIEINIGWAINIYSTAATSNNSLGYSTFVSSASGDDKFGYTNNNRSTLLAGEADGNAIALSTPISIFNDSINSSTVYLYYSIVFANDNSTLYKEVDSGGRSLPVPSTEAIRRFKLYNNEDSALEKSRCNSNCYQGLTFALNALSLTF